MDFIKEKEYFVGIDSDGTAFDTMKIKHISCFIPAAVEVFGLESCAEEFRKIESRINLYSLKRGINRFLGLLMTFEELIASGCYTADTMENEGLENLKMYMKSGLPLSNTGFREWLLKFPTDFGQKVLQWSELVDIRFEHETKAIEPYDGVISAVDHMHKIANIMVVSAASTKGLEKDWGRVGLTEKVSFIAGQEFGKKVEQLMYAREKGFDACRMLMIGDAPGDYEAAKQVGAWFYPIIPSRESECWNELEDKYFDMFVDGQFDSNVEMMLYERFVRILTNKDVID
ncbi:MAG: HAD family hydrolase [Agathobacter sp.]|nr:HAD family hydrolase [Lachnospiraceae bacterium]MBR3811849.1 HAD family hydrolase [Agathobacter sp.]